MTTNKDFLYIGHYIDINGNYILKIGTTNNLKRRQQEHTRKYQKAMQYTMPNNTVFQYDWSLPLSKYNTLRYEDTNKKRFKALNIGEYIRNDRFNCGFAPPSVIPVKIRKEYFVSLH